jgi:hypothetical protein
MREATGSSESASGSKIYARGLTSFRGRLSLVNDRNPSVLPVSVLTGPAILTRCEFLYKLEVSCRVNRRYHVHWLKTSFGPAYEAGIDASDGLFLYIIIIIIHTPYCLRHAVLLLFLSHRKPSNGENYALRCCYALTASTSCDRCSLVDLFIST